MHCNVCLASVDEPLFKSARDISITSLTTLLHQPTTVYSCRACGHIQTPALENIDEYYNRNYTILIDSEEEDALYKVINGENVYRTEHQARTVMTKAELAVGARILEYGAAKGATVRRLLQQRSDLSVYLFDVSEMYVDFWRRFVPPDHFATYDLPEIWTNSFDAILSFFVLEHVSNPVRMVTEGFHLLRPGGLFYFVVPNVFVNTADMMVVDHANHFTLASLDRLLIDAGFVVEDIDAEAHDGAFVVSARRPVGDDASRGVLENRTAAVTQSNATAERIAAYWRSANEKVATMERRLSGGRPAIYGGGFYGSFIAINLTHLDDVAGFVDQNPFLHGRELFGRPVMAPRELDPSVTDVFVGLNPTRARRVIADINDWGDRKLRFHYL